MNIARLLIQAAARHPDRPAVSRGSDVVFTYAKLANRTRALAGGLRNGLRLAPKDRVAIMMGNCPEYLEVLFAIWQAGLCAVPINARLHGREAAHILESSEAVACIVDRGGEATLPALPTGTSALRHLIPVEGTPYSDLLAADGIDAQEVAPEDTAWLFYTSGTTGRPKGAMLSHRNLLLVALTHYADIDSLSCLDTMVHAAPLSHGCGLWSIASIGRATNNVVLESSSYDPNEVCRLIERWPSISMYHAPTMLKRLVNSSCVKNTSLTNLKTLIYGGSHMYLADLQHSLKVLGPKLVQIYGQGESPNTITMLSKHEHAQSDHWDYLMRLGSAGTARTGIEVRIVDDEDRSVPTGQSGEVLARGDIVMSGYWRDTKASAITLAGGWLHTGDIGVLTAEGFLTIKDRVKDMIISGGSNIYPREIEEILLQHPGVLEVSVLGRPHQEWGEEVFAFVVRRDKSDVTESDLDALCLSAIARYKRPRAYCFVSSLPKSNYGKILKTALRDELTRGGPDTGAFGNR